MLPPTAVRAVAGFLLAALFAFVQASAESDDTVLTPPRLAEDAGWLGIAFRYYPCAAPGCEGDGWIHVLGVAPAGPAEAAGLRALDVITAVDGVALGFQDDVELLLFMSTIRAGRPVRLTVIRGGEHLELALVPAAMTGAARDAWDGNFMRALRKRARDWSPPPPTPSFTPRR